MYMCVTAVCREGLLKVCINNRSTSVGRGGGTLIEAVCIEETLESCLV